MSLPRCKVRDRSNTCLEAATVEVETRTAAVIGPRDHPTAERDGDEVVICPDGTRSVRLAFTNEDFPRWLAEVLKASGLPGIPF